MFLLKKNAYVLIEKQSRLLCLFKDPYRLRHLLWKSNLQYQTKKNIYIRSSITQVKKEQSKGLDKKWYPENIQDLT